MLSRACLAGELNHKQAKSDLNHSAVDGAYGTNTRVEPVLTALASGKSFHHTNLRNLATTSVASDTRFLVLANSELPPNLGSHSSN